MHPAIAFELPTPFLGVSSSKLTQYLVGPETSVLQYLTGIIDGKIGRVSNGLLPELDIQSCLVHRELARYAVHDELESSLFAISHGSLGAHKIIVDNEYNITG